MTARSPLPRAHRAPRPLPRLLARGAAGIALLALALGMAGAAGAAAPAGCIPINYATCLANGVYYTDGAPTTVIPAIYPAPYMGSPIYGSAYVYGDATGGGYPPNTVVSTYFDPRYGIVSVVTDASGVLIDVDAVGRRIYPIYPDYGPVTGYYAGGSYPFYLGR